MREVRPLNDEVIVVELMCVRVVVTGNGTETVGGGMLELSLGMFIIEDSDEG